MKKIRLIILNLFVPFLLFSQIPYEEGGNTRFRFAQLTIGGDLRFTPQTGQSYFLNADGETEEFRLGNNLSGRFVISGWHFWGHVDFYIAIPLLALSGNKFADDGKYNYLNAEGTGVKIYPSKIREGKLRPYIGTSFNGTLFQQQNNEINQQNFIKYNFPVQGGLTFVKGKSIFDVGVSYNYATKYDYYISKTQIAELELPKVNFSIGYRTYFDTSVKDEPDLLSGKLDVLADKMKKDKKANSFSFALGLSSSFHLNNNYNTENFPFVGNLKISNSFIDYGIGYYMHKPDIHLNLAFRNHKSKLDVFDANQIYHKTSLGLEAFKFLFDYQGFVPFVGPVVSYDINRMDVMVNEASSVMEAHQGLRFGLAFGWDIRQDEIQSFILRTNLRYYPFYNFTIQDKDYKFNQLEVNIIQLVFYPTRHKWRKNNKTK